MDETIAKLKEFLAGCEKSVHGMLDTGDYENPKYQIKIQFDTNSIVLDLHADLYEAFTTFLDKVIEIEQQ